MTITNSRLRRAAVACMSVAAAVGITVGATGPATAAPSVQQLADVIKTGLKSPKTSSNLQARQQNVTTAAAPTVIPTGTDSTSSETVGVGPRQTRFIPAFAYSAFHPDAAPPGANNYSCKPKSGQRPVVLVHGTWESAYDNFAMMSPDLTTAGFCVYTFNYGKLNITNGGGVISLIPGANGTGDIPTSAGQLAAFVDKVLARTGASKVDIVGHSQGGVMARQYLKFNGGQAKVQKLITLGATNHGTTLDGIGALGRTINNLGIDVLGLASLPVGVAGIQQVVGSDFINNVNAGGDTLPGIDYTIIRTKYDEVTTPSESTFLTAGPGATVKNITLQDGCPIDFSDHVSMSYSPRAITLVQQALDPTTKLVCTVNGFITG
ncbi:esterase/lipase family protein [Williamsia serinedens]|uniref:Lipase (Class 2) n=1 Tax=Williamsia serinedens TaxID=391736 RepID=A0ABT1H6Q0_9NOCA|nr:alpha/beta fold hydrolase [Williamsia serinedens]MCP2162310.1 Lipase (class 2) [Williamsia serinedens]